MTTHLLAAAAAAMAASAALAGGDFKPVVPQYDAETFFDTTSIGGGSFSHDEQRLLISSDESGVFNVYSMPVGGGEPTQLTNSTTDANFATSYFPNDDRFLFGADQGGNELNHVYVRELDGEIRDLTPGEEHRAVFYGWSHDLESFFIGTNERDPRYFDVYEYDTDTYERERFYTNTDGLNLSGISRDKRWVSFTKTVNNADNNVYLLDRLDPEGGAKLITPHEGWISHNVMGFTPDSKTLFIGSNEDSEFNRVWAYDIASGGKALYLEEDWDINGLSFSFDGRYRTHSVNADARTVVKIYDTKARRYLKLPEMPAGDVTGTTFSRSGDSLRFYVNGPTSPSNLYVMDVESREYTRLTDTLSKEINADHLVQAEVIRFKSFDSLEIPSILYKPHGAGPDNRAPVMLWIHGGPGGQSRTGYNPVVQHLVNHGYAVLAVNNRGSSGYGKTFFHLDDQKHGEDDLMDCVFSKYWLEKQDWVDADRIGIMGGSYGGYMVCAAMAFQPGVFDVGVNIFGVTNWVRTLESIPAWWESARQSLYAELGDPATDKERLHRISPLFHADKIRDPMLVVQGANDPRVLQVESDEMVEAIQANGVPVDYILFPDEGHGFRSKANRITASNAYLEFLDRYLTADGE